jgi:hypothetical protein
MINDSLHDLPTKRGQPSSRHLKNALTISKELLENDWWEKKGEEGTNKLLIPKCGNNTICFYLPIQYKYYTFVVKKKKDNQGS